jgi:hypothetical protein
VKFHISGLGVYLVEMLPRMVVAKQGLFIFKNVFIHDLAKVPIAVLCQPESQLRLDLSPAYLGGLGFPALLNLHWLASSLMRQSFRGDAACVARLERCDREAPS